MKRFFTIFTLLILVLSACSSEPNPGTGEQRHLVMADAGWDSIRLHNAIVGFILESAFETTWEEIPGSTAITYEALRNKEIDLYTEVWTENIAPYQSDVDAGVIVELGINFDDNAQGLYVPAYMIHGDSSRGIEPMTPDLKTISDLAQYASIFKDDEVPEKGRIYGAIPGWEVDDILRKKVTALGLDETFNYFTTGSDAALAATLTAAYERGEAIVGYYWEPTWLTGKYDFIRLEDEPYSEETYRDGIGDFPSAKVTVAVTSDFEEKYPDITAFLRNYRTSSQLTSSALAHMMDTGADISSTAVWFLNENLDLVENWLEADAYQKLVEALERAS